MDFGKKTIVWIIHPETEGESCAYCTNFGASIPFRDFFCYIIIKKKFGRGGIAMSSKTTAFTDALQDSPVIASGLLQDKSDVMAALSAGAIAISTTDEALWFV